MVFVLEENMLQTAYQDVRYAVVAFQDRQCRYAFRLLEEIQEKLFDGIMATQYGLLDVG